MARKKINVSLLLEFLSVVFAVSLALLLNEWRQNVKTEKLVARVRVTVETEIKDNLEIVSRAIEYRSKLLSELEEGTHRVSKFVRPPSVNYNNDQKLTEALQSMEIQHNDYLSNDIQVITVNTQKFLKVDNRRFRMKLVHPDTIYLYGVGNIQLKSASISNNSWGVMQATNATLEMDYELVVELSKLFNQQTNYLEISHKALDLLYTGDGSVISVMQDMLWYEKSMKESYERILILLKD